MCIFPKTTRHCDTDHKSCDWSTLYHCTGHTDHVLWHLDSFLCCHNFSKSSYCSSSISSTFNMICSVSVPIVCYTDKKKTKLYAHNGPSYIFNPNHRSVVRHCGPLIHTTHFLITVFLLINVEFPKYVVITLIQGILRRSLRHLLPFHNLTHFNIIRVYILTDLNINQIYPVTMIR